MPDLRSAFSEDVLRNRAIPGIDVTERPFTSADSRAFAQQPGPGNPNVGAGGSAQANEFRESLRAGAPGAAPTGTAPAAPAAPTKPSLLGRTATGVGNLAGQGVRVASPLLRTLGPAAAGVNVIAGFNDYKLDDPEVDSSAAGTFNALADGDFSGAGRSLRKGFIETAADVGGSLARVADLVVPGEKRASGAFNNFLRDQFGDQISGPGFNVGGAKPAAARAAASVAPIEPNSGPPVSASGLPLLNGRTGTSVPGAEGVSRFNEGGRTFYSNVPGENSDAFRSPGVNNGINFGLTPAQIAAANAPAAQPEFRPTAANPAPGVSIIGGGGSTGFGLRDEDSLARRNAGVGINSSNPATASAARASLRAFDRNVKDNRDREALLAQANITAETARRGQDVDLEKNRYTADQSLRGQLAQRDAQAAKFRYDVFKDERQFAFDREKFGEETANKNLDARVKAGKDATERVQSFIPKTGDEKLDSQVSARAAAGVNAFVSDRVRQLEAQNERTPGRQDVMAELKLLRDRGPAALGESELRRIALGTKLALEAESKATSRFNPFGSSAVQSTAPITGLRREDGLLGPEFTTDRGDRIVNRDLRNSGGIFGIGGRPVTEYDELIQRQGR